jgi:glycosyltransferase involved in cell wall biosynthesis
LSNNPLVTIVTPVYNGEKFIEQTIVSVINQTYQDWELIIGVNGHPPNSDVYALAKKYETRTNKIKVFDFIDENMDYAEENLASMINLVCRSRQMTKIETQHAIAFIRAILLDHPSGKYESLASQLSMD